MGVIDRLNTRLFYPDLRRAGGLKAALDRTLDKIGSPLHAVDDTALSVVKARVERGRRFVQVHTSGRGRKFLGACGNREVSWASAHTWSLRQLAQMAHTWVTSECSITELVAQFEFVTPHPDATAYERTDEADVVVRYLPPECQPAISATSNNLAAIEQTWAERLPVVEKPPLQDVSRVCQVPGCTGLMRWHETIDSPAAGEHTLGWTWPRFGIWVCGTNEAHRLFVSEGEARAARRERAGIGAPRR